MINKQKYNGIFKIKACFPNLLHPIRLLGFIYHHLYTLCRVAGDRHLLGVGRTGVYKAACVGGEAGTQGSTGNAPVITRKSNPVTAANQQQTDAHRYWTQPGLDSSTPPPVTQTQGAYVSSRSSLRIGYGSGRSAPPRCCCCCCLPRTGCTLRCVKKRQEVPK